MSQKRELKYARARKSQDSHDKIYVVLSNMTLVLCRKFKLLTFHR